GDPAQPQTITINSSTTVAFALQIAALAGPIIVNDVIRNSLVSGTLVGTVNLNPEYDDFAPITLNGQSTYGDTLTSGNHGTVYGASASNTYIGAVLVGAS